MFKKLIEKIYLKIGSDVKDKVYEYIAQTIEFSFNNSSILSKEFGDYWAGDKRQLIKNAITEAFEKNISKEIKEEISRQLSCIHEEAFIDKIVERIKRKQIN